MLKPMSLASLLCAAACASTPTTPPQAAAEPNRPSEQAAAPAEAIEEPAVVAATCPRQAGICFEVVPGDAELKINDDILGAVQTLGASGVVFVSLEPGIHLVTLKREGFATWRSEVTVGPVAETMKITLEPAESE